MPGVQNVIGSHNHTIFRGGAVQNCPKVHTKSEQGKSVSACSLIPRNSPWRGGVIRVLLVAGPSVWFGFREQLDDLVEEGLAVVKRLDAETFIAAVESDVVAVKEDSLDSIRRDTGDAQGFPVGSAHDHDWPHRHTWPESVGGAPNGLNHTAPIARVV